MQIREVTFEMESGRIIRASQQWKLDIDKRHSVGHYIPFNLCVCVCVCVDGYAMVTPTGVGTHAEVSRHGPST